MNGYILTRLFVNMPEFLLYNRISGSFWYQLFEMNLFHVVTICEYK